MSRLFLLLHALAVIGSAAKDGMCPAPTSQQTCSLKKCTGGDDSSCSQQEKCCLLSKVCGYVCVSPVVLPTSSSLSKNASLCLAAKCYGCRVVNGTAHCGCIDKTNKYYHSQMFMSSDGCNTCWCRNGTIGCTKKACTTTPPLTCQSVLCPKGTVCVLKKVQCITTPCYPVPQCVKPPTGVPFSIQPTISVDLCATVRCGFGQVCVVQSVQCKQPPCGQQAVCIGGSSSTAGTPTVSPCAAKYANGFCRKGAPCTVIGQRGFCGCIYNGQFYRHQSKVNTDGSCDDCYCDDGALACSSLINCGDSSLSCRDPSGVVTPFGSQWMPNSCTTCLCALSAYGPRGYCVTPSCDYCPGGRRVPGQCCPVCPTKRPPTVSSTAVPTNVSLCRLLRYMVRGILIDPNNGALPTSRSHQRNRRAFTSDGKVSPAPNANPSPAPDVSVSDSVQADSFSSLSSAWQTLGQRFPFFPLVNYVENNFTRFSLKNNDSLVVFAPICNSDGSFQREQCVTVRSKLRCFCVNPTTGDPYAIRQYQPGTKTLQPCRAPPRLTACQSQLYNVFLWILKGFGNDDGRQRVGRAIDDSGVQATPYVVPSPAVGISQDATADNIFNLSGIIPFVPTCNNDGSFASMQCDAANVSCWCVNSRTGVKLSGTDRVRPLRPLCKDSCTKCYLPCPLGQKSVGTNCTGCRCESITPICLPISCSKRHCNLGQVPQGNNCTGCQCVADSKCPPVKCGLYCPMGFQRDKTGCFVCGCIQAPTPGPCATASCLNPCPRGNVMTGKDCSTCSCRSSSSPCSFRSLYACFNTNELQSQTVNSTCRAATAAIGCYNRLVNAGQIAGCSASEKKEIGERLAVAKKRQIATCQKSGCRYGGNSYRNNDKFPASDGCNTCVCSQGSTSCTEIGCVGNTVCVYNSTTRRSGSNFNALDGCNTCVCSEGTVACTEKACDQTRYLHIQLRFAVDYKTVITNEQRKKEFMTDLRTLISRRLQISPAQVTIIDVKEGSIIVEFSVQAPDLDTVQQQLDDDITSQSFEFIFNSVTLIPDNTQVTYQKQVGAIPTADDDDEASNTALIVGVVCGVIAAVVLVVVIVVIVIVRQKKCGNNSEPVGYSKQYSASEGSDRIKFSSQPL